MTVTIFFGITTVIAVALFIWAFIKLEDARLELSQEKFETSLKMLRMSEDYLIKKQEMKWEYRGVLRVKEREIQDLKKQVETEREVTDIFEKECRNLYSKAQYLEIYTIKLKKKLKAKKKK